MEERAHEHPHAAHRTGFHWLDVSLALSAFLVSLASLWLTVHNARTMEKLVASNSYPNLDVQFDNLFDFQDGQGLRAALHLYLVNSGIGPARLRAIEIGFAGKPAADLPALLVLCCTQEAAGSLPKTNSWSSGDARGVMIQAGRNLTLFAWPRAADDPRWARLEAARKADKIGIRVCYCSVFDECYLHESQNREPKPVRGCPVPAVPYTGG
ncbi:MAG TPA: hypothetical protein VH111_10645 [Steroidobacteraceae bacterium]|jgi:hypothetical protein|nr:hypothetical protein [Steroidobacteraceae bacterium]